MHEINVRKEYYAIGLLLSTARKSAEALARECGLSGDTMLRMINCDNHSTDRQIKIARLLFNSILL